MSVLLAQAEAYVFICKSVVANKMGFLRCKCSVQVSLRPSLLLKLTTSLEVPQTFLVLLLEFTTRIVIVFMFATHYSDTRLYNEQKTETHRMGSRRDIGTGH